MTTMVDSIRLGIQVGAIVYGVAFVMTDSRAACLFRRSGVVEFGFQSRVIFRCVQIGDRARGVDFNLFNEGRMTRQQAVESQLTRQAEDFRNQSEREDRGMPALFPVDRNENPAR